MVKRLRLRASSSRCPSSTSSFTNTFLGIQRRSGSCELQKGPISVCSYRLSTAPQSHPQGEICSALRRLLRSRTDHKKRWSILREVAATAGFRFTRQLPQAVVFAVVDVDVAVACCENAVRTGELAGAVAARAGSRHRRDNAGLLIHSPDDMVLGVG